MRITLDIDNTSPNIVKGKAILLKTAFPNSKVQWRTSSSKKGGHILMYSSDIDECLMYNIRYLLGDHDKRIAIDYGRGRFGKPSLPRQVLFDYKKRKCGLRNSCPHFDEKKCIIRIKAGEWNYV